MVVIQESINSRFCSVVEIKLSFFLKGGHLPRSGSRSNKWQCKSAITYACAAAAMKNKRESAMYTTLIKW